MNQALRSLLDNNRLEFCKYRCRIIKDDESHLNPNTVYEHCYYCPIKDFNDYIEKEVEKLWRKT